MKYDLYDLIELYADVKNKSVEKKQFGLLGKLTYIQYMELEELAEEIVDIINGTTNDYDARDLVLEVLKNEFEYK